MAVANLPMQLTDLGSHFRQQKEASIFESLASILLTTLQEDFLATISLNVPNNQKHP